MGKMAKKKGAAKVSERKIEEVKALAALIQKYPTVAMMDMTNLPASQLHEIRAKLHDKILIKMGKKERIRRALEAAKSANKAGADKLAGHVIGMPALLLSELDPFELFRILKENQSPAQAKSGQIAPNDVLVCKGPTPLAPGPIISKLSEAGIKAGIEAGKVVIKEDSVVAHKGDRFSPSAVEILNTLGIKPMKIGVNLLAALEGGEVYTKSVLDINIEECIDRLASAHSDAWKLAIGAGILVPQTVSFLIIRAEAEARKLALEAGILTKESAAQLLSKAEGQAQALGRALKR